MRVYHVELPKEGRWRAQMQLEAPCGGLELFTVPWSDAAAPTPDTAATGCIARRGDAPIRSIAIPAEYPSTGWYGWAIGVAAPPNHDAAFALSLLCAPEAEPGPPPTR